MSQTPSSTTSPGRTVTIRPGSRPQGAGRNRAGHRPPSICTDRPGSNVSRVSSRIPVLGQSAHVSSSAIRSGGRPQFEGLARRRRRLVTVAPRSWDRALPPAVVSTHVDPGVSSVAVDVGCGVVVVGGPLVCLDVAQTQFGVAVVPSPGPVMRTRRPVQRGDGAAVGGIGPPARLIHRVIIRARARAIGRSPGRQLCTALTQLLGAPPCRCRALRGPRPSVAGGGIDHCDSVKTMQDYGGTTRHGPPPDRAIELVSSPSALTGTDYQSRTFRILHGSSENYLGSFARVGWRRSNLTVW